VSARQCCVQAAGILSGNLGINSTQPELHRSQQHVASPDSSDPGMPGMPQHTPAHIVPHSGRQHSHRHIFVIVPSQPSSEPHSSTHSQTPSLAGDRPLAMTAPRVYCSALLLLRACESLSNGQMAVSVGGTENNGQALIGSMQATSMDSGDVYHAYPLHPPPFSLRGDPVTAFILLESINRMVANTPPQEASVQAVLEKAAGSIVLRSTPILVLVVRSIAGKALCVDSASTSAWTISASGSVQSVEFHPLADQAELFARSKGLLETEVLNQRKVAVVGLGSGGSPIALELVKAGIGTVR
jgi:hypothetical protein